MGSPMRAPLPHPSKRVAATLAALILGGGPLLSVSFGSGSSGSATASVTGNCVTVLSANSSCSTPSGGGKVDQSKQGVTAPQLDSVEEVGIPAQIRRSGPATVYGAPSIQGGVRYELDPGRPVKIVCQQWGEVVRAPRDGKLSALWDRLGTNEWAPDALVDTNSDRPVTRFCDRPS